MMSISSGSNDLGRLWPIKQLRRDKRCNICFSQDFNPWQTCIRKNALVNLHHGFVSRARQLLLLLLQIVKYTPVPSNYNGSYFKFKGPLTEPAKGTNSRISIYQPRGYKNPGVRLEMDTSNDPTLPRPLQQLPVLAYGKYFYIFIRKVVQK